MNLQISFDLYEAEQKLNRAGLGSPLQVWRVCVFLATIRGGTRLLS